MNAQLKTVIAPREAEALQHEISVLAAESSELDDSALAAMRGMPEARDLRAELAGQMTKDDVAEALKQARAWLAMHAPSKVNLAA